jgi:hypothetical protein
MDMDDGSGEKKDGLTPTTSSRERKNGDDFLSLASMDHREGRCSLSNGQWGREGGGLSYGKLHDPWWSITTDFSTFI